MLIEIKEYVCDVCGYSKSENKDDFGNLKLNGITYKCTDYNSYIFDHVCFDCTAKIFKEIKKLDTKPKNENG